MRNPIKVKVRRELIDGGLAGIEPKVRAGAIDGLNVVGLAILNSAKKRIKGGGKSGITYKKYRPRRTHIASAPGESPATDTGGLINSGFHELDEGAMEVSIGFAKFYAAFLEYGTRMVAKRPFLLPTVDEWRSKIAREIEAAIKARLKR